MNTRAFTLALIISILSMFMVWTYIEDQQSVIIKEYGTMVPVVVARKDIKELDLIDDSKVTVRNVPQKFAMPGSFRTMKDVENTIATVPIIKGEQLTKPRVTYPGAKTGLSRQVSVGKRAVAISITEDQAVSKLLKPGDRVDILSGVDYSDGRTDMRKVQTILQDVLVLSTGMSMTNAIPIYGVRTPQVIKKMNANTYSKYNTVTLELDPFQVQKLSYLILYSGGKPYLSLRNNADKKRVRIKPTAIFDLLDETNKAEAKIYFQEKYKKKRQ